MRRVARDEPQGGTLGKGNHLSSESRQGRHEFHRFLLQRPFPPIAFNEKDGFDLPS